MIDMSKKSATELCGEWRKYRTILAANEEMVNAMLDDINNALFAIDPKAGFAFTKALARDPDADPADHFTVLPDAPRRARTPRTQAEAPTPPPAPATLKDAVKA